MTDRPPTEPRSWWNELQRREQAERLERYNRMVTRNMGTFRAAIGALELSTGDVRLLEWLASMDSTDEWASLFAKLRWRDELVGGLELRCAHCGTEVSIPSAQRATVDVTSSGCTDRSCPTCGATLEVR